MEDSPGNVDTPIYIVPCHILCHSPVTYLSQSEPDQLVQYINSWRYVCMPMERTYDTWHVCLLSFYWLSTCLIGHQAHCCPAVPRDLVNKALAKAMLWTVVH